MSAFIVSDKTLADVHQLALVHGLKYTPEQLIQLNTDSVNSRYNENDNACDIIPEVPSTSIVQLVKSLSCFLYQSCEGECEESQIFKDLHAIKVKMKDLLDTPEYNKCEWDR